MRKDVRTGIFLYAAGDYFSALFSWLLFRLYSTGISSLNSPSGWGHLLLFIPGCWLLVHLFSGAYFNPYRKSRFIEINRTLISSLTGSLLIYLFFILPIHAAVPWPHVQLFLAYFLLHFLLSSLFRIVVLKKVKNDINRGRFGYNTLIIGGNQQAIALYREIKENEVQFGYNFKGFVYADDSGNNGMSAYLPKLGSIEELQQIIDTYGIEEVVIAVDTSEHNRLQHILAQLSHRPIIIKITPDLYDIISGSVKMSNVFATILIEIYPELMPDWQRVIKRFLDIVVSSGVLILLSPLYLFAAIRVKLSSPGPVFYKQKRIGLYGKPFWIYKFRSMMQNAEESGPALSSKHDMRITRWGRVMRKWRIDELPQFYNIIKGDMSLVGPRPERQHFIDIIRQTHPHFTYLHKVKPGLSSWGMVKFGYAENTQEMIERMRYDLLYIKNCSLILDFKIMFYTILVILQGRGK